MRKWTMNPKSKKKQLVIISLFALCSIMLFGCGDKKNKNGSMISDDGRSYGGTIKEKEGETVNTAFFDLKVEEASKYNTYQFDDGLYQANEGEAYLVLKLTIKNTYEEDLPMSITDFTLDFDDNKSKDIITGYGKTDLNKEEFMENIFTLKKGETITKYILYTVKDVKEYRLCYTEFYEDKFEGDTYQITMMPKIIETTTEATTAEQTEATTETPTEATTETPTEATTAAPTEATTEASTEAPTVTQ